MNTRVLLALRHMCVAFLMEFEGFNMLGVKRNPPYACRYQPLTKLAKEGFVPQTGLSMFNLTSPLKENSISFMFRESE